MHPANPENAGAGRRRPHRCETRSAIQRPPHRFARWFSWRWSLPTFLELAMTLKDGFGEVLFHHRPRNSHALGDLVQCATISALQDESRARLGGQAREGTF